ncbi:MAG: hypothetical protein HYV76_02455 [Candidatus Vogelbacteria bacterium]|nr:hypothetical protein [Candidatus Vogelbacteria bacterium]
MGKTKAGPPRFDQGDQDKARRFGFTGSSKNKAGLIYRETEVLTQKEQAQQRKLAKAKAEAGEKAKAEELAWQQQLAEMARQSPPPENLPTGESVAESISDEAEDSGLILGPRLEDESGDSELSISEEAKDNETGLELGWTPEDESKPPKLAGETAQQLAWRRFKEAGVDLGKILITEKAVNAWRFARERIKGLSTFGFWEVHQAEGFRTKTSELAQDLSNQSASIRQESGRLSHDEAQHEAERMNSILKTLNEGDFITADQYEATSQLVSSEKIQTNQAFEDRIVSQSLNEVQTKFLGKTNFRGQLILTPERLIQIEDEIRGSIKSLRHSQMTRDLINHQQLFRKNLDQEWYKRYVAAGIEAALASVAIGVVTYVGSVKVGAWWGGRQVKTAIGQGAKHVIKQAVGTSEVPAISDSSNIPSGGKVKDWVSNFLGGKRADPESLSLPELSIEEEVLLTDGNLWNITKNYLVHHGVNNPTDAQILEAAKEAAKENGIGVKEWGISGKISDRQLSPGTVISLKKVAIKAGIWTTKKAVKNVVKYGWETM